MADAARAEIIARADTVVVKVGTNVLADSSGAIDRTRIQSLAEQLTRIRTGGRRVALVSSGAIAAGIGRLGLGKRPTDLPHLQACAAVGQCALMQAYQDALSQHGTNAAQILLTAGDFDNRVRYLNARHTVLTLFEYECLPVINENDTVSVAEIKFGDNDHLAAMVANLLQAPLLVLLTNVDGLFTDDPRVNSEARLVETVPHIDKTITDLAAATQSALGTGGMRSKLRAARLATAAGGAVIMANGSTDRVLDSIFANDAIGTLFLPHGEAISARRRWLGLTARPRGSFHLDDGARKAVEQDGRSLLPVGVLSVAGTFGKGEVVSLCNRDGIEFARGLTNYSSADADRIRGLATDQIQRAVGKVPYVEMIHRDNLAVVG
jgi:glutamate 5-kinase